VNLDFNCGECNQKYPLVIGSGFPLVYVAKKVHDSMDDCCKHLHRKWAARRHDEWYNGRIFENNPNFIWR